MRGGAIQRIHDIVDPALPPGVAAYYNGSLEISETYNRITLDNQRTFTPPIFLVTLIAVYLSFRSWRKMLLTIVAVGISVLWTLGLYSLMGYTFNVLASMLVPLIVVLAIADDVHIMQHWDEERRHKSAEDVVQGDGRAPGGAAARRQRDDRARHGLAGDQQRGGGAILRHRLGGRHHGRLHDLARVRADAAQPDEAGDARDAARAVSRRPDAARSRCSRRAIRGRCCSSRLVLAAIASFGIVRLRVDTNHINFFSPHHPLGQSARVIDDELSGIYSFQILLEGPPESLGTPESLQRMERLEDELRKMPDVKKVRSVADYVRRVNKELHDGDPAADVVPADAGDGGAGAVRLHARRRRTARARARRRQRLLARADRRQAAGDELRRRPRA